MTEQKRLSLEERNALMHAETPTVGSNHSLNLYFNWNWKYCGFGQLRLSQDNITKKVTIDNECMSRGAVRKILHAWVDHTVDNAIFEDETDVKGLAVAVLEELEADIKEPTQAVEGPEVKRSHRLPTLTDGSPVTEDHREINPATGQQKAYVVLSVEERAKGFVRSVRTSYVHKTCGAVTTMGTSLAETYARDPKFYGGTFCCACRAHFIVAQFHWDGFPSENVGS